MRELKFRAWNPEEKIMGPPFFIGDFVDAYPMSDNIDTTGILYMQYSGLKDKNGKEIYEHDILRYTFPGLESSDPDVVYTEEVQFLDGCFSVDGHTPVYACTDWDCEVIGNIYENPELCAASSD